MKIHFADSEYWDDLGEDFQKAYKKALEEAYHKAASLLPFGSNRANFFIQPRDYSLIEETHDAGRTYNSSFIELAFDPVFAKKHRPAILGSLQHMVFHEMNHAARFNLNIWHTTALDMCLLEGLAVVFERDYSGASPLWGLYDKKVIKDWVEEIRALPDGIVNDEYLYLHSDGRKWIGYKVGTYIVDEAMKKSGKTVIELTQMECKSILKIVGLQ